MIKILLIGSTGQVGWELQRSLQPLGSVIAVSQSTPDLAIDLTSTDQISTLVRHVKPQIIINAAAYTAVDRAESEPDIAQAINGIAPGILAEEAKALGAILIHYSTDYVFNGRAQSPYVESATPDPLNVYGKTKLAGEEAIVAVDGAYLILRTSWVYGIRGRNFLKTVLRLAQSQPQLKIVNDQWGGPTWSRTIAESTSYLLTRSLPDLASFLQDVKGIYHLTCGGTTTWYEFAREILTLAPPQATDPFQDLTGIPTSEYPTPAERPRYSVLDTGKIQETFGLHLPDWQAALSWALAES
ncbi:MAG: dTDP-4-dehydrorhamnose reductase [Prochlorotrichaceae cyanobacterium]